jgi:hypothetical protein
MTVIARLPSQRTPEGATKLANFDTRISLETEASLRLVDKSIANAALHGKDPRIGRKS